MKPLNYWARVLMATVLVVGLGACGKKKNGSSAQPAASTPSSTCTWNGTAWVLSGTSTSCTPTNTTTPGTCPSNGQYTDQYGQTQSCIPGQPIGQYPVPGQNYPWNNGFPQGGCSYYEYMYGTYYVPIYMQQYNQYMCVRYDLVMGYTYNTPYYDYGYNYYYAYPPHTGNNCGTQIYFGADWGNVGVCF